MSKKRRTRASKYAVGAPAAGDKSLVPMGTNKLKARDAFRERGIYAESAYPAFAPTPMNGYDGFNLLYGRVDKNLSGVYPAEDFLKQLPMGDGTKTNFVLDFVADAFSDLREYFKKAATGGRIQQDGTVYAQLDAALALSNDVNIHTVYKSYLEEMYSVFVGQYLDSEFDQKIKTFDDFMKIILNYITKVCYRGPFTRIAFCTSKNLNPRASGIVIELYEGEHGDDYAKYVGFIRDNNFSFFARACERFGFSVDKNAPWRIWANLDNPYMKEKMSEYGIEDTKQLFMSHYIKAIDYELENLKRTFFQLYSLFLQQYPDVTVLSHRPHASSAGRMLGGEKTRISYEPRQTLSWEQYDKKYSTDYWIRLLVYLRAVECRKSYTQREFDSSARKALEYYNYMGIEKAIEYIEKNYRHTENELLENNSKKDLTDDEGCDILLKNKKEKLEFYRPSFYFYR